MYLVSSFWNLRYLRFRNPHIRCLAYSAKMSQVSPITPWTDAFPKPRSDPGAISDEELVELIKTKQAGKDYIVVDVRRTDFEVYFYNQKIPEFVH